MARPVRRDSSDSWIENCVRRPEKSVAKFKSYGRPPGQLQNILLKLRSFFVLITKYNQSISHITTWCGHISASIIVLCVRVAMKQIRWEIFLLQFTRRGWLVFVRILISRSSSLGSSSKHEKWSREGNVHTCDPRVCRSRQIGNYIDCAE